MTTEEFNAKQAAMSNDELIELAAKEVSNLAQTYGNSHHMTIPPMITDTDMILSELIRRFKELTSEDRIYERLGNGDVILIHDYRANP